MVLLLVGADVGEIWKQLSLSCQGELGQLTQADESPGNNGVVPVDIGKSAQVSLKVQDFIHCCLFCPCSLCLGDYSLPVQNLAGLWKHLSANKKPGSKESVLKVHLKPAGISLLEFALDSFLVASVGNILWLPDTSHLLELNGILMERGFNRDVIYSKDSIWQMLSSVFTTIILYQAFYADKSKGALH